MSYSIWYISIIVYCVTLQALLKQCMNDAQRLFGVSPEDITLPEESAEGKEDRLSPSQASTEVGSRGKREGGRGRES